MAHSGFGPKHVRAGPNHPLSWRVRRAARLEANVSDTSRLVQCSEYHTHMGIATGTVVEGKVLVEGALLPEGAVVTVLTREASSSILLSPEDEAALLEAIAEAERGDTISPEELFARLEQNAKL